MSFNKEKMVTLILNECESIEERCAGYRQEILNAIVEILDAEREHKAQGTNIQKQIDQDCDAVGKFLYENRDRDNATTEVAQ